MATQKPRLSALDRLKKAANLKPIRREVELENGELFVFWSSPLTMAEQERAQNSARDKEDATEVALHLFVQKAADETGKRLFSAGQIPELKNEVRQADLNALMLALAISKQDDLADEELDPKK
tara:strand:- start:146 stop:514 length:369 start_codon:yes stop_codon:yes gene_type:complete